MQTSRKCFKLILNCAAECLITVESYIFQNVCALYLGYCWVYFMLKSIQAHSSAFLLPYIFFKILF